TSVPGRFGEALERGRDLRAEGEVHLVRQILKRRPQLPQGEAVRIEDGIESNPHLDELVKMGIGLDTVLNANGLTLRQLGTTFEDLSDQVHLALGPQVASALQGFAEAAGDGG